RAALLGICERERGSVRTLAGFFPRALPSAQTVIATVLARAGGDEATGLLAAQLGSASAEADALLLLELAKIAGRDTGEDQLVLERVRGILGHPDARLATLGCLVLEKLRDHEAVPDLIVLLSDDDPNLRRRAHAALTSLTGLTLPAEEQPWIAWLAEAFAWWDERSESCRVALVSGSATEAAAAVHETAGQRLFVDQVVEMLALTLGRPEPDLVASACRALGAIPERTAHEALAPLVAHPDPAVAERARAALRRHEHARQLAVPPSLARIPARSSLP
ncbi:MAG: HAD family hydrolase, partial [Planctomycetes bacterium]|nr:HAD family hydrolase [Planctomycetota bacterium]